MTQYYAPYRVTEGVDIHGHYRVEDKNTFKTIGFADRETCEQLAHDLNLAYSHFIDRGGMVNA